MQSGVVSLSLSTLSAGVGVHAQVPVHSVGLHSTVASAMPDGHGLAAQTSWESSICDVVSPPKSPFLHAPWQSSYS